jgi:thiosulfate/3-mercaptopyruvate sulfurtransferase
VTTPDSLASRCAAALFASLLVAATSAAAPVAPWPRVFVAVEDLPADPAGIVVLDVRGSAQFKAGHLPGAQRVDWTRWRKGLLTGGALPDDLGRVARDLAKLGVDDGKRVLVCGTPLTRGGWGEDGRVAWLLRYLGHDAVAVLDGGCDAWFRAGRAMTKSSGAAGSGRFTPRPHDATRARKSDVVSALPQRGVLVDVRSRAEYDGATPYFESRGGRIPGAVHLAVQELVDADGRVRSRAAIAALLGARGLSGSRPLIVYCTGGVRSAFATLAFESAGVSARNYDGSFWEWADDEALPVEK